MYLSDIVLKFNRKLKSNATSKKLFFFQKKKKTTNDRNHPIIARDESFSCKTVFFLIETVCPKIAYILLLNKWPALTLLNTEFDVLTYNYNVYIIMYIYNYNGL